MLRNLPPNLFVQGQPLRASAWNTLVDASEEMVDVWSGEHLDGTKHASPRLESAAIGLEWNGSSWGYFSADRLAVASSVAFGNHYRVELKFDAQRFWSSRHYAVIAQCNQGAPCLVPQGLKRPDSFVLFVPSPAVTPTVERVTVVVFGRERGAE